MAGIKNEEEKKPPLNDISIRKQGGTIMSRKSSSFKIIKDVIHLYFSFGLVQTAGAHLELLEERLLVLCEGGQAGEEELHHVCEAVLGRLAQQLAQPRLKTDPDQRWEVNSNRPINQSKQFLLIVLTFEGNGISA